MASRRWRTWVVAMCSCAMVAGVVVGSPSPASATVRPILSVTPNAGPVGSVVTVRFGPTGNGCGGVTFEPVGGGHGGQQSLPFVGDSGAESFLVPRVFAGPGSQTAVVPGRYVFSLTCDTTNNPATAITVSVPFAVTSSQPRRIVGIANTVDGKGYWLVGNDGGVFSFGDAHFFGSLPSKGITPAAQIVGIVATHDQKGYWLVGADGGVYAFGDARFFGSAASQARAGVPVVGMAATPSGNGYWLAAAELNTFHLGDAKLLSLTSRSGNGVEQPVAGIATSPSGAEGYWQVVADGTVFGYGAAYAWGSTAGTALNAPIVGVSADPRTRGYWEVAADGGVFSFDAPFFGSTANLRLNAPVTAILSTPSGRGYRLVASDGGVFDFGDAHFYGSAV